MLCREAVIEGISDAEERELADYTVYYPLGNEDIWDIGKKYKVPMDSLCSENPDYAEESGEKSRYLIIPRREKPILNEII